MKKLLTTVRNLSHPLVVRVTLSGKDGDDAKPYQENECAKALSEVKK